MPGGSCGRGSSRRHNETVVGSLALYRYQFVAGVRNEVFVRRPKKTESKADEKRSFLSHVSAQGLGIVIALIYAFYGSTIGRRIRARFDKINSQKRSELSRFEIIRGEQYLYAANLSFQNLDWRSYANATLTGARFYKTQAWHTDLRGADLQRASIIESDLSRSDLTGADLRHAVLTRVDLSGANLTGCHIYGISVWDVKLDQAIQRDLVIAAPDSTSITVDNLEVAQFIYLLLSREKIREVINTLTTKVVLILGRFTPERKAVLLAIKDVLREHNYVPVLFDFEKPTRRDFTETISTLAHLSRFIIADITEPRSIPQELQAIVPHLSVPIVPLFNRQHSEDREYGMFGDLRKYPWVLELEHYSDVGQLLAALPERVIARAEAKIDELRFS